MSAMNKRKKNSDISSFFIKRNKTEDGEYDLKILKLNFTNFFDVVEVFSFFILFYYIFQKKQAKAQIQNLYII